MSNSQQERSHRLTFTLSLDVIVNLMCQLDWATGCPDIWSNIIVGVSVRGLRTRLTFESVD